MSGMLPLLLLIVACHFHLGHCQIAVYQMYEYCFPMAGKYKNPFDYNEVNVIATITPPSKIKHCIDGFYYQEYIRSTVNQKEELKESGSPQWCIRYTPVEIGKHSVNITINKGKDRAKQYIVNTTEFQVVRPEDKRGFIRVAGNQIHFTFDDDTVYFPIGENSCWPKKANGTLEYDNLFNKLSKSGVNYARLWLTDAEFNDLAVEIANFNISLPNTWRLDYVVQLAEKLDIRLLMCTESFNCFRKMQGSTSGFWDKDCYYNKKFGGIIDHPEEFFTSEEAKSDYQMRLRYLVSRYGYSTAVFAWEFFNEVDITTNYNEKDQMNWINEMSEYLRSIDVNQHLISTSFTHEDILSPVQALPGIDFTMSHYYGFNDTVDNVTKYVPLKQHLFRKPSFVAEFGGIKGGPPLADKYGVSLHNGLWSPIFNMGAGTSMSWWWESWVDLYDLYSVFKPVNEFIQQFSYKAGYVWKKANVTTNFNDLRVSGMSTEFAFAPQSILWVQDQCYTWTNNITKDCQPRDGVILHFIGCEDGGVYSGVWYNTHNGTASEPVTDLRCDESTILNITAPTFIYDIAFLLAVTGLQ